MRRGYVLRGNMYGGMKEDSAREYRFEFALKSEISSLKQDTSEIKFMMTKIFMAFRGQSSSAPSSSVPTTTLAIIEGPTTVGGGQNLPHTITITLIKETPSQTEGEKAKKESTEKESDVANVEKEPVVEDVEMENVQNPQDIELIQVTIIRQPITQQRFNIEFIVSLKPQSTETSSTPQVARREGKGIATDETKEPTMKIVPASKEVYQDPDEPIRVPYEIHGKIY
ncbi:hypothetical protein Tco_0638042 [Tanacetum coccineum]